MLADSPTLEDLYPVIIFWLKNFNPCRGLSSDPGYGTIRVPFGGPLLSSDPGYGTISVPFGGPLLTSDPGYVTISVPFGGPFLTSDPGYGIIRVPFGGAFVCSGSGSLARVNSSVLFAVLRFLGVFFLYY